MLRINLTNYCALICAIILTITNTILGQESSFLRKPWPTYSLQNMPQTRFTCHDKILGGYYADPETQCQMFHVCVKVAGVGVQDFRFLCPNATAFDQEAQICADWGDVDCESSVLYYGSDNFDLYRLGSGFESKRAPLAEEDESTFHLQRAESGDVRRFKETRVDQKSRPDQPPNYTKHYETVTSGGTFNNNNYVNTQQHHIKTKKQKHTAEATKIPIVSYYTPTSTSTTTTTTTTERNYNDDSKQDLDDIFKGSHSSNFFSNRNGGREDDLLDHPVKSSLKPNDFADFNKKSESPTIGKSRVTPSRSKRPLQTSTPLGSTTTTTTTAVPKNIKKVTVHSSYNTDFYDFSQFKSTTHSTSTTQTTLRPSSQERHNNNRYNFGNDYQTTTALSSTTTSKPARARHSNLDQHNRFNAANDYPTSTSASTTQNSPRPSSQAQHNNNRYNFGNDYQTSALSSTTTRSSPHHSLHNNNRFNSDSEYETQAKIQPTTYNPNRLKSTTAKFTELKRDKSESTAFNKPTAINRKLQKFEQTQQKYGLQNSTFVNANEFNEFVKIKPQEPQAFQPQPPAKIFEAPVKSNIEPQYHRSRGQARANNNQQPEPFRTAQRASSQAQHNNNRYNFGNDYQSSSISSTTAKPAAANDDTRPRGFVSRGRINYKATTQRESETYPTSTANAQKKFSTLVPKDKYAPTTFKPSTYKKTYDNTYYQSQQTIRPSNKPQKSQTSGSSTTVYTTANPYYSPDEDDGQYHPELYETDFPRNKLNKNLQRSSSVTSTSTTTITTQKPHKLNYQNPATNSRNQQDTSYIKEQSADLADFSDEDELFKTAHSLNFGAASINKLRADIIKAEKTSQQYNSQYNPHNSITSPTTTTTTKPSTSTTTYFTYPSYSTSTQTTARPTTTFVSTTTTTTTRPTTTSVKTTIPVKTTTTPYPFNVTKSGKHTDKVEKKLKKNENKKKTSKRPPHADEDTSYDYAYYDSDTLSETPQEYPEYEIQEFTKTRKN